MRSTSENKLLKPSPRLSFFENVLLVVTLSLIILRVTYIENPHIEQMQTQFFLTSEIVSLYMSTVLLACFALWLLVSFLTNRFRWRKTSLGVGTGLFLAAGVIACWAASDKRAAVTDLVVLMTPMVTAMFLVQLLATKQKTQLAVLLVLAVGVTMAAQCIDQLAASNKDMIQAYERNPAEQLRQLNIEPDSLEQWMYEHRLYSKNISGFLMTSNSAASFFLLAVFGGLGVCIETLRLRRKPECVTAFVGYALAVVFVVGGLFMTQSKGGIGAFGIGLGLLAALSLFGGRLWRHRVAVAAVLLIGLLLSTAAVIAYGVQHGRLPGGNSMLVRWQYWQATVHMIADHLATGIGGGNFGFLYPLYKIPAASETIQDPHNFILSLLSQYGPLGLLAFLAAVLYPVFKSLKAQFEPPDWGTSPLSPPKEKRVWLGLLGVSTLLLLFIRPMLVDTNFLYQSAGVRSAAYVVLYLFPAGVFVLAFGLLGAVAIGDASMQSRRSYLSLALICGMAAVLIHNLVDFALFEPGIWSIFWLFSAMLVACRHNNATSDNAPRPLSGAGRLAAIIGVIVVFSGYLAVAVIPPVKANRLFRAALFSRTPQWAVLDRAVAADPLAPDTAYNAAGMMMQMAAQQHPMAKDDMLLERAAGFSDIAQQRNPESFKPWRLKTDIALMQADNPDAAAEKKYLDEAYADLSKALARYPGSDRIHYNLAQVADRLNRPREALAHYQKAVAIEQAYQAQFKVMYPDRRPVISRLGNTAYTIATARIEELQKQLQTAPN